MATRQTESQVFVTKFCLYIDELLQAWDTAGDINYLVQPDEPGCKANYCAINLGLTVLGNKLPYEREKWWYNSTPKSAKEKWPEIPQELQNWKKRAKSIEPDAKIYTHNFKTLATKNKIEKFIRVAEEALDIQRYSGNTFGIDENQQLCIKGRIVNQLALELGLVDADWYLAKICHLYDFNTSTSNPQKNREINLKLYEELGIDSACGKQPFIFTDVFKRSGYIYEDELQLLVTRAKALLESMTEKVKHESEAKSLMLSDLEHPVPCSRVAGIVHKRSDNVARSLRSHKYPIIVSGDKSYCDAEHAAVLWPKWKKYWRKKQEEEKI